MDVEEVVLTWTDEGVILVDALVAALVPGADEEVLEEMALWFIAIVAKTQPYKVLVPLLKGKSARVAHVSATIRDDEQLRHQFE